MNHGYLYNNRYCTEMFCIISVFSSEIYWNWHSHSLRFLSGDFLDNETQGSSCQYEQQMPVTAFSFFVYVFTQVNEAIRGKILMAWLTNPISYVTLGVLQDIFLALSCAQCIFVSSFADPISSIQLVEIVFEIHVRCVRSRYIFILDTYIFIMTKNCIK